MSTPYNKVTTMRCKCGTDFKVFPSRAKTGRGVYCSKACLYKYRTRPSGLSYNIVADNAGWFEKGRYEPRGDRSPYWKGDEVGYQELHRWVRREKLMPTACDHCGRGDQYLEWANKSHEYKRDLTDWLALCKPCHGAHDSGPGRGHGVKKYGSHGMKGFKEKPNDC